jgi:hypothetical protein
VSTQPFISMQSKVPHHGPWNCENPVFHSLCT